MYNDIYPFLQPPKFPSSPSIYTSWYPVPYPPPSLHMDPSISQNARIQLWKERRLSVANFASKFVQIWIKVQIIIA